MTKNEDMVSFDLAVNEAVEIVRPLVESIEAGISTTMNNYGEYLKILFPIETRGQAAIAVVALCRAGANKQGVIDAFNIIDNS